MKYGRSKEPYILLGPAGESFVIDGAVLAQGKYTFVVPYISWISSERGRIVELRTCEGDTFKVIDGMSYE